MSTFERSKFEHEPMPPEVEYYVLLDFDRCIGNTDCLQAMLEDVVAHHSFITPSDMRQARQAEEDSGGSFDTSNWVKQRLREARQHELWEDIASDFVARGMRSLDRSNSSVLMPGARQLLDHLDQRQIPYGFLTFGSADWQTTKLQAAGQAMTPQLIVDSKNKGQLLARWQQPDGKFLLPSQLSDGDRPLMARHIVFMDDKPVSFIGAPSYNTTLIHVMDPSGKIVRSQKGETPDGVFIARGLREAQTILEFDEIGVGEL